MLFSSVWEGQTSVYPHTHMTWRLSSGRLTLLLEQRHATSHWGRWCFPLCPGSGWRLLFVPPVIAWRIDSEQYAISQTVIKPRYSFFTTSVWVLETQWPTVKWHLCLLTAWPLPVLLSLLHFTAPALLSPYVSFESSALISGLCTLSFTEHSAIQCDFFPPLILLFYETRLSCIRTLRQHFSGVETAVLISLSLILPQIFHFHTLSPFLFPLHSHSLRTE